MSDDIYDLFQGDPTLKEQLRAADRVLDAELFIAKGREMERAEIASRLAAAAEAACPGDTCHGLPSRYQGHLPGLPCAELALWARELRGE